MAETAVASPPRPISERTMIWALVFGNFVIGTGVLLPSGMLTDLANGLGVSIPTAGGLMLASGVVVALGSPLVAAFTNSIDRRTILCFSLLLYAAGHAASALAPNFETLLVIRVVMVIGAAIFTPQAAMALGVIIPPERRTAAITLAFLGWSLAMVAGTPLAGWIAHSAGWRSSFVAMTAVSLVALVVVWRAMPGNVKVAPLDPRSWVGIFASPVVLTLLLVTTLNGTGQFTVLTYFNPLLKGSLAIESNLVTAFFTWFGLWATAGNIMASRIVARLGPGVAVTAALAMVGVAFVLWGLGSGTLPIVIFATALWGLGTFAINSMHQARMSLVEPALASAAMALNTSAMYVGHGLGASLGGGLIRADHTDFLPLAAAAAVFTASGVSAFALRLRGGI